VPAAASTRVPAGVATHARGSTDTERVVFQTVPVRVVLPVDQERVVSLPGQFALHAPEGFDTLVRSQIIERTAYLKALAPFGSLRVVAEDLTTGRQIPLDLVSVPSGSISPRPMEVFVPVPMVDAVAAGEDAGRSGRDAAPLDMVALTRHAAQALYAPRRLIPSAPSVRQVPVDPAPVEGLYRGWRIETVPIGAWRSGDLYVTAVRFTNTGDQPIDLDLQELRGRWLAATAQHMRLLASDPAWRTTTVYLVCDRPFAACR
jgi:integrating conjugative element protein (TIGR03749 family)